MQELVALYGRTFRALKRHATPPPEISDAYARGRVARRHMPVLVTVASEGPLGVSEIAQRIGLSVATTSLMVGELSRAGLLDRAEDDSDRRRTIVTLHASYEPVMRAWIGQAAEPVRRALERLSPPHRERFMEGWRLLAEEVARFASEAPVGDEAPGWE